MELVHCVTPEYSSGWLRSAAKILRKLKGEDEELSAGKYWNQMSTGTLEFYWFYDFLLCR